PKYPAFSTTCPLPSGSVRSLLCAGWVAPTPQCAAACSRGSAVMFRAIVDETAWSVVLGWCVLMVSTVPAMAQGRPAPGPNQAFLYEMSEDAVLLNAAGSILVPDPSGQSPTGLVDSKTGLPGMPAVRHATSQLQGVATLGSLLCPFPLAVTVGSNECTVIATGIDEVQLVPDQISGQLVPQSGAVWGTYAVLVQLDNSADSPEMPV